MSESWPTNVRVVKMTDGTYKVQWQLVHPKGEMMRWNTSCHEPFVNERDARAWADRTFTNLNKKAVDPTCVVYTRSA